MSIFTFVLDASSINGHDVLSTIYVQGAKIIYLVEFKVNITNQFVSAYDSYKIVLWTIHTLSNVGGSPKPRNQHNTDDMSGHILLRNKTRKSVCVEN